MSKTLISITAVGPDDDDESTQIFVFKPGKPLIPTKGVRITKIEMLYA